MFILQKKPKVMKHKIIFLFFISLSINAFTQLKYAEHIETYKDLAFSKISADYNGAWLLSKDSTKVYRCDMNDVITECVLFRNITKLKFTSILSKGPECVVLSTNTDSVFILNYSSVSMFSITYGLDKLDSVTPIDGGYYTYFGSRKGVYYGDSYGRFNLYSTYNQSNNVIYLLDYIYNGTMVAAWFTQSHEICVSVKGDVYNDTVIIPSLENEIPLQTIGLNGYQAYYLRTNKRILFCNNDLITEVYSKPSNKIIYYPDSILIATNNGIKYMSIIDNKIESTKYPDYIISDLGYDAKNLWIVSDNQVIKNRKLTLPNTSSGDYPICKNNPPQVDIFNIRQHDSICWYRNDTLIDSLNHNTISLNKIGKYKSIIINKYWNTVDTLVGYNVILSKTFPEISLHANSEKMCKNDARLNINVYNYKSIKFYKDDKPYSYSSSDYTIEYPEEKLKIYESGTYWFVAENCNGYFVESNKAKVNIVNVPSLSINIENESIVCPNKIIKLSTNANDYGFSLNDGTSILSKELDLTKYVLSGSILLFYHAYDIINGCYVSKSIIFQLANAPYAEIVKSGSTLEANTAIKDSKGNVMINFDVANYQWYLNGNVIPNATNAKLNVSSAGEYKVEVTDKNLCSNFSIPYKVFPTNLEDEHIIKNIWPNPTKNGIHIDYIENKTPDKVEIINSSGNKVFVFKNGIQYIDLSTLPDGLYYVAMFFGSNVYVNKITLQK